MTLEVTPDELDSFARRTEELSQQCVKAADHTENYLSIGASDVGAIFLPVMQQVEEVRETLIANIDTIRHLTDASAQNLADAAQNYRAQETVNVGDLDVVGSGLP